MRDAGCLVGPGNDATPPSPGGVPDDDMAVSGDLPDEEEGDGATDPSLPAGEGGTIVAAPSADGDVGPADVEGSSFLITGNNSARLAGESFGMGRDANDTLRRSVPVRLATPSADLEIEAAHVMGKGAFFHVAVIVTNRANATLCDIDLGVVGIVNAAGETTFDGLGFGVNVEGSVARTASGRLETQCLAPGESSYAFVFAPESIEADEVVVIAVDAIASSDAPVTPPMSRIVPVSYTVNAAGGLDVTVRNEGLTDVESGYAVLVVLDDDGYPLRFTNDFSENIVPAGGQAIIAFDGASALAGRAVRIRVIVGYNDVM